MKKYKIKYSRKCPRCKKELYYKDKYILNVAIKKNRICISCAKKGFKHTDESKMKISEAFRGENHPLYGTHRSDETKEKLRSANLGKKVKNNIKKKIKNTMLNHYKNEEYKQKHKERMNRPEVKELLSKNSRSSELSVRLKISAGLKKSKKFQSLFKSKKYLNKLSKSMRIVKIKEIEQKIGKRICPNYNKNSIPILEQKAKELNITDLQHAENGGEFYIKELGYWIDGYSKEKNIVIEIDEKHHFDIYGNLKEKDIKRENEITNFLKCKFIRIKI